jgi:hypothetical protein
MMYKNRSIQVAKRGMGMEWITVQEAGALWDITTRGAQFLCAKGQDEGAQ